MKFISLIIFQILLITTLGIKDKDFIKDLVDDDYKLKEQQDSKDKNNKNTNTKSIDTDDMQAEINMATSTLDEQKNTLLINTYLNRGYSVLTDQNDLLFRPSTTLSRYSIFDYNLNIEDMMNGIGSDELILEKFERAKINKGMNTVKEYVYEELKKAQDFVVHGEVNVPFNNFIYQRGKSIKELRKKKTVIYFSEKIDFTISLNMQKRFPKLSKSFVADSVKIFDRAEVKDFNTNKEFIKDALDFFNKYGTHYLNRTKYGSRFVWITELNLTKFDNQPAKDTPDDFTHIKSGRIAFESSRDDENDRLNSFEISAEIGNCQINMNEAIMEKCNNTVTNYGLLGFEVEKIFRVYDVDKIKNPIKMGDGISLTTDRIKNMFINMKFVLDSLLAGVDIRNHYIKDLIVFGNFRADFGDVLPCTQGYKIKRFGNIEESLYSYDWQVDRFFPVFKIDSSNKRNHRNLYALMKNKFQTFICNEKERLYNQGLTDSPYLFNKRYLNKIDLFYWQDFLNNSQITKGYDLNDCQNLWVENMSDFENPDPTKVVLMCSKYANNFLDNDIITDIKVKMFEENKCQPFDLLGRHYDCLCDKEIKKYIKYNDPQPAQNNQNQNAPSDGKKNISKFICYSKKIIKD